MKTSAIYRDSVQHAYAVGALLAACAAALLIFASCSGSITTEVKGDRNVVMITTGVMADGGGHPAQFFIVRDPDTGVDYLAILNAGIIKLEPKPEKAVEKKP